MFSSARHHHHTNLLRRHESLCRSSSRLIPQILLAPDQQYGDARPTQLPDFFDPLARDVVQ